MQTIHLLSARRSRTPATIAVGLGLAFTLCQAPAQSDIVIVDATHGGTLTWTAPPALGTFTIEWSPSVTGPWTNSWAALANIPNTGATCTAQLPVFYRVLGRPYAGILLHGDGTNGATAILDAQGHPVNVYGNARVSTTNSHFGSGSILFDGNGDYLNLGISSDWAFAAGDFTVDLWANFNVASGTLHLIGLHTQAVYTEWSLVFQGTVLNFYINGVVPVSHTWTPTVGQWYHLAVTRSAGTLRLFVDGKLVKSAPNTTNLANNRDLTIGAANNPNLFFNGLLDEVHIVKGRALWTEDFTPPIAPYGF